MSDKRKADEDLSEEKEKKAKLKALTITDDHCIVLNTGAKMPLLGFGTFKVEPRQAAESLRTALKTGYKHIDCAKVYENEHVLGEVFTEVFGDAKSGIRREDIFVTSKLPAGAVDPKKVRSTLESTLADLKLSYLDLYLVHLPVPCENGKARKRAGYGLQDVWREMEAVYEAGLARAIGVSNYPTVVLNDLLNYAKIPPAVHQIERHPYLTQAKHVKFCRDNEIAVTAYASLGAPGLFNLNLLKDPVVLAVAAEHKRTPAQVLIRWSIDGGVIAIPKSVNPERIVENFNVLDFKLTEEQIAKLDGLERNGRAFLQEWQGIPVFV